MQIRKTRMLSEQDEESLFGWGKDIFGMESLKLEWRQKVLHFTLYIEGRAASHVGTLSDTVTVGSQKISICGIGAVVTRGDAQKRGLARKLLAQVINWAKESTEAEFGFLFCRPPLVPFYESMGWQLLKDPVLIEQSSGRMESPIPAMVLPLTEAKWPPGEVILGGLPW
ncbi:MAG: GNAT family N-acetyltransferase [Candidatus Eiseniibacteriota bacterium]|nr:MAG: GNAT family N-acetyltransferase [Candidatus Eisenbacteria bacterium]